MTEVWFRLNTMLDIKDFKEKQIVLVYPKEGDKISFLNDNLIIKDKEDKIKFQTTCYRIFGVFIVGGTQISTGLIERTKKFGFVIVLFTISFRIYEVIGFKREANYLLHKKQYAYSGLDIAKHIIRNKMFNQVSVLNDIRIKSDEIIKSIDKIDGYVKNIDTVKNLNELMAYEGLASKVYFSCHFNGCNWKGRQPRIKMDYINSILDIGYTVLFAFVEAVLCIYGFDTYCGVMHTMFYMRKSLVCDIMEPFRCIIDYQTKKSINLRQFKESDFTVIQEKYQLEFKYSSQYVSVFLKSILDYKEEIFLYIRSYYRAFMKNKSTEDYPFFKF